MSKIKTDSDLVRIARQMEVHFTAIRNILYDLEDAEHPGKQTFLDDLNSNGLTAFAWPEHIVHDALIHPERWQTYDGGIRYMGIGKEFESHLGRKLQEPEGMKVDPECEQFHGQGCAQCNDTIYYAEEELAEQVRRDRAWERAQIKEMLS